MLEKGKRFLALKKWEFVLRVSDNRHRLSQAWSQAASQIPRSLLASRLPVLRFWMWLGTSPLFFLPCKIQFLALFGDWGRAAFIAHSSCSQQPLAATNTFSPSGWLNPNQLWVVPAWSRSSQLGGGWQSLAWSCSPLLTCPSVTWCPSFARWRDQLMQMVQTRVGCGGVCKLCFFTSL